MKRVAAVYATGVVLAAAVGAQPAISALGAIEARKGGFIFPDRTVQETASGLPWGQVIIVAKSGGDHRTITRALDSINDASGLKRYLIWVGPGIYEERVTMKRYVGIRGAGRSLTTIRSHSDDGEGTVVCADDAELSSLKVQNLGGGNLSYCIVCDGTDPLITEVDAEAIQGGSNVGIFNKNGASPTLTDVYVDARSNGAISTKSVGIRNESNSKTRMERVRVSATGATFENIGIQNRLSSPTTMTNVDLRVGGSGAAIGIKNEDASAMTTTLATIEITVGSECAGVQNSAHTDMADPIVLSYVNAVVSCSSATDNVGLRNQSTNLVDYTIVVRHSTFYASDTTGNSYGVLHTGSTGGAPVVFIDSSQLLGTTAAIDNGVAFTTKIGASLLGGGAPVDAGSLSCAGVYDDSYSLIACP